MLKKAKQALKSSLAARGARHMTLSDLIEMISPYQDSETPRGSVVAYVMSTARQDNLILSKKTTPILWNLVMQNHEWKTAKDLLDLAETTKTTLEASLAARQNAAMVPGHNPGFLKRIGNLLAGDRPMAPDTTATNGNHLGKTAHGPRGNATTHSYANGSGKIRSRLAQLVEHRNGDDTTRKRG